MKIVINSCHGGFGLSKQAVLRYLEIKGLEAYPEVDRRYPFVEPTYWLVPDDGTRVANAQDRWLSMSLEERAQHNRRYREQVFTPRDVDRNDPYLVQVVEELGKNASGRHSQLKIVEIPDDVKWQIQDYDGCEWVAEVHRTWE